MEYLCNMYDVRRIIIYNNIAIYIALYNICQYIIFIYILLLLYLFRPFYFSHKKLFINQLVGIT